MVGLTVARVGTSGVPTYGDDMPRHEPEPVSITSATRSHTADVDMRQRKYLISMGVRTLCFVLAVFSIGHWFLWVFITASFVLPYFAVVVANAGASPETGGEPGYFSPDRDAKQIEGPPAP